MQLDQVHISALRRAEELIFHFDFCPYLALKALLHDNRPEARQRFRSLFMRFYGLNIGGLTEEFMARYFEILHGGNVLIDGRPDFEGILNELGDIKGKRGYPIMPFSFVSKLAAMHVEDSPIYDRHVCAFFRAKVPGSNRPKSDRIKWFVDLTSTIATSYQDWVVDPQVVAILDQLKSRDAELAKCHPIRLIDFLVWKVGSEKLLQG